MASGESSALYLEIEKWLRVKVLNGQEGDNLPSEVELSQQFGVSRMTARQAMQNLAAEGLVRRQRGAGTFIAPRPLHRHSGPLMSFTADMKRRGLDVSSVLLTAELRAASVAEAQALKLGESDRVVSIVRLRLADLTPMAVESVCLIPTCVAVLAGDLESGSLHAALSQMGYTPTKALSWISTRLMTSTEGKLLGLAPRSPVLVERRIISDQKNEPLEYSTSVYHPERYVIDAVFNVGVPNERESY